MFKYIQDVRDELVKSGTIYQKTANLAETLNENGISYPFFDSIDHATMDSIVADNGQMLWKEMNKLAKNLSLKLSDTVQAIESRFVLHNSFKITGMGAGESHKYVPFTMTMDDGQILTALAKNVKNLKSFNPKQDMEVTHWYLNKQDITAAIYKQGDRSIDVATTVMRIKAIVEMAHRKFVSNNPMDGGSIKEETEKLKSEIDTMTLDLSDVVFGGDKSWGEKLQDMDKRKNPEKYFAFNASQATLTFNSREDADEFAKQYSRKTLNGHMVSATGNDGKTEVKVDVDSEEVKNWIDEYVANMNADNLKNNNKKTLDEAIKFANENGFSLSPHADMKATIYYADSIIDGGYLIQMDKAIELMKDFIASKKQLTDKAEEVKSATGVDYSTDWYNTENGDEQLAVFESKKSRYRINKNGRGYQYDLESDNKVQSTSITSETVISRILEDNKEEGISKEEKIAKAEELARIEVDNKTFRPFALNKDAMSLIGENDQVGDNIDMIKAYDNIIQKGRVDAGEDELKKIQIIMGEIRKTGIQTSKDFESMLSLEGKENHDKENHLENGDYSVYFELIESEDGWGFSHMFKTTINGKYIGDVSADDLRELLKDRYKEGDKYDLSVTLPTGSEKYIEAIKGVLNEDSELRSLKINITSGQVSEDSISKNEIVIEGAASAIKTKIIQTIYLASIGYDKIEGKNARMPSISLIRNAEFIKEKTGIDYEINHQQYATFQTDRIEVNFGDDGKASAMFRPIGKFETWSVKERWLSNAMNRKRTIEYLFEQLQDEASKKGGEPVQETEKDGREDKAYTAGIQLTREHKRLLTVEDAPYWVKQHESLVKKFIEGSQFKFDQMDSEEGKSELRVSEKLEAIKQFMPEAQYLILRRGIKKTDFEMKNVIDGLYETITTMPKTYEQDGKGDEAVVYLHYFNGNSDWWITEKDMGDKQQQAFGLVSLHGYDPELGYVSIEELTGLGVELDFYWDEKTVGEIKKKFSNEDDNEEEDGGWDYDRDAVDSANLVAKDESIITNWDSLTDREKEVLRSATTWDLLSSSEFVAYNYRQAIATGVASQPYEGKFALSHIEIIEDQKKGGEVSYSALLEEFHGLGMDDLDRAEEIMTEITEAIENSPENEEIKSAYDAMNKHLDSLVEGML